MLLCRLNLLLLLCRKFLKVIKKVIQGLILSNKFLGANLSYSLNTRNVIRCVSPNCENIYNALRITNSVQGAEFLFANDFNLSAVDFGELVLEDVVIYNLPVILIGSNHIDLGTL